MEATMVRFVLVLLVLGLAAGHTLPDVEGTSVAADNPTTSSNTTREDNQCSPLQRRQDLLDNRLTERDNRLTERDNRLTQRDTDLSTRLNGLNARQDEVDARLNRMDGRFDDLETAMSDMKEYLCQRLDAMEVKAEWALAGTKHKGEVGAQDSQPTMTSQSNTQPTTTPQLPKDCQEAYALGSTASGVYTIAPEPNIQFDVYCEQELDGGGWVVFQLRKDGTVDFDRNWSDYKEGFGQLMGEFWLGNDKIHLLTKHHDQELKIRLVSPDDEVEFANYANFWIEGPAQKFKLSVSGYSGGSVPGDSLAYNHGMKFSTRDEDNDAHASGSCAQEREGAWWYKHCSFSNLNGPYGDTRQWKGVVWSTWKGAYVSMKGTQMMLRKKL